MQTTAQLTTPTPLDRVTLPPTESCAKAMSKTCPMYAHLCFLITRLNCRVVLLQYNNTGWILLYFQSYAKAMSEMCTIYAPLPFLGGWKSFSSQLRRQRWPREADHGGHERQTMVANIFRFRLSASFIFPGAVRPFLQTPQRVVETNSSCLE